MREKSIRPKDDVTTVTYVTFFEINYTDTVTKESDTSETKVPIRVTFYV